MAQTWYDTSSTIVFLVHQREVEIVMITIFIIPKLGGLKPLMICRNSLSSERSQNHLNLNQDYRNTIITTPLNFLFIKEHLRPSKPHITIITIPLLQHRCRECKVESQNHPNHTVTIHIFSASALSIWNIWTSRRRNWLSFDLRRPSATLSSMMRMTASPRM